MPDSRQFDDQLREALEPTYVLERELKGGGMSRVFLATERSLNRSVVIKVLPPELAAGVNRDRFRREIQLAAQLQHPHIVPLYSAGEHGELLWYTMPFIEGDSLRDALHAEHRRQFSIREVVGILHDVVDAIAYAHARGVIHRDIKPGNVLRSGSHAVVTDFGVAKAISVSTPVSGVTTSGMAVGTPAYMAPEQLAGDPAADHRMDIYAVGLLAYELLVGTAPFASLSPTQTLAAQLTRDPPPLDTARNDIPPALSALVMRCLSKAPEKRPQTAAALLAELDSIEPQSGDFPATRTPLRSVGAVTIAASILLVGLWAWSQASSFRKAPPASAPRIDTPIVSVVQPAPPVPLLTRAESLAIADAVARKVQQTTAKVAAAPAQQTMTREQVAQMTDSLRTAIQTAVIDSFMRIQRTVPPPPGLTGADHGADRGGGRGAFNQGDPRNAYRSLDELNRMSGAFGAAAGLPPRSAFAERAANPGPPRRVFVSIPSTSRYSPDVDAAATLVMDSLRRRLAMSRRYMVVDRDTVRIALSHSRVTDSLATLLNVDMFASLHPSVARDSSVQWTLMLHDMSATPTYANRSVVIKVPRDSLLTPLDSLVGRAMRVLEEMDRAPRRRADDAPRMRPGPVPPAASAIVRP